MTGDNPVPGNLLDTHVALWATSTPEALSKAARKAVLDGPNFLSVVSFWEVMIKSMKGTLDVGDPRAWWEEALDKLNAAPVLLRPEHVEALNKLPAHHKDPFDRMLAAQAIQKDLPLLGNDAELDLFGVRREW